MSPTRSRSVSPSFLTKAASVRSDDISVDVIRSALHDFVQRLAQTERDKVMQPDATVCLSSAFIFSIIRPTLQTVVKNVFSVFEMCI